MSSITEKVESTVTAESVGMEADNADTSTGGATKVTEMSKPTEIQKDKTENESDNKPDGKPVLAKHDSSILDLAFAMDCTGSMGSYIANAQASIRHIVEEIVAAEKSDVHLALVEYRDHPPQDSTFVTRVLDFTPSVSKMKKTLDKCSANGGGDTPEAVADALHQVLKLSWREEATKICVFIADAPPHGLGTSGDGFSNGCPDGLDPMEIAGGIASKGITMYMVGCEPAIVNYKDFFMAIAHMTGGQYVPLSNAKLLSNVIIGGAQEEITLERLMRGAQEEVEADIMAMGGWERYDECEDMVSAAIMTKLNAKKGLNIKQLQQNDYSLPEATKRAKKWSKMSMMSELRHEFSKDSPASTMSDDRVMMASAAPASSGGIGGSMLGRLMSFGSKRKLCAKSRTSTPVLYSESAEEDLPALPADLPASSTCKYTVVENDFIDQAQAKRMVQKIRAKKEKK